MSTEEWIGVIIGCLVGPVPVLVFEFMSLRDSWKREKNRR